MQNLTNKTKRINLIPRQKETHRYRKQTYGQLPTGKWGGGKLPGWD